MNRFARWLGLIGSLLIIAGSLYGITHRQEIMDYLALRNYTPSDRIVALADQTTMKPDTRRVFYVNHPQLNDKPAFRDNCPSYEASIVLGCYVEPRGIYLLDVDDPRLDGVIQVTAAHEVLHAHYERLSNGERQKVDSMTSAAFENVTSERIKKAVEQYRKRDPSIVPNELHSILATEVRQLPDDLENYYARYFTDRAKIVEFSENYEQTFVDLTNQVEQYDQQLQQLKQRIESNQLAIEAQNIDIEREKARLDALLDAGRVEEYNAAVPAFNAMVNRYNSLINDTKGLINRFNEIVVKRNEIATTEQELYEAINSNIEPKQTE